MRRLSRFLPMAVMAAVVMLGMASPASAATTYHVRNALTGDCLDSNNNKNAYTNPCGDGNGFQRWYFLAGNWGVLIKDFSTGYCLDSNANGTTYTNPCSAGNAYQNWVLGNFSGGFGQYRDFATGFCLRVVDRSVRTENCSNAIAQTWNRY